MEAMKLRFLAILFVSIYVILSVILGLTWTVILASLHLVIIPLLFRYSKTFQQQIVFLNYVQWPIHSNFSKPSDLGLSGARNLYIEHESKVDACNIRIGVWHVLPLSSCDRLQPQIKNTKDDRVIEALFHREMVSSGLPIIMYCHGNANHRAARHRIKLYQVLQKMDVHVIAFDYRGYGDSSPVLPSEVGVVEDSLMVYAWLRNSIELSERPPPVYVWGHSLGSGISSHLIGNLETLASQILVRSLPPPNGLILESPFNNLRDVVNNHFMTVMARWLPYYEASFVDPFAGCPEYEFTSDQHLSRVRSLPMLILHAKDDYVIPYRLGVKLHDAISASRASDADPVHFHTYEKSLHLGHTWICEAEDLPQVISEFLAKTLVASSGAT